MPLSKGNQTNPHVLKDLVNFKLWILPPYCIFYLEIFIKVYDLWKRRVFVSVTLTCSNICVRKTKNAPEDLACHSTHSQPSSEDNKMPEVDEQILHILPNLKASE